VFADDLGLVERPLVGRLLLGSFTVLLPLSDAIESTTA
jgi:hypothetical protein